jgi:hypothetical protein
MDAERTSEKRDEKSSIGGKCDAHGLKKGKRPTQLL